jgi:hypothetical protein
VHPMNRSVIGACLGLAFFVVGAGTGSAATVHVAESGTSIPTTQCNADPGIDASNDPVHCHYEHPLPVPPWRQVPAPHHHHHHG